MVLDFKVRSKVLSVGSVVGIVAASCVLLILILIVLRKKGFIGGKDLKDKGKIDIQNKTSLCSYNKIA